MIFVHFLHVQLQFVSAKKISTFKVVLKKESQSSYLRCLKLEVFSEKMNLKRLPPAKKG